MKWLYLNVSVAKMYILKYVSIIYLHEGHFLYNKDIWKIPGIPLYFPVQLTQSYPNECFYMETQLRWNNVNEICIPLVFPEKWRCDEKRARRKQFKCRDGGKEWRQKKPMSDSVVFPARMVTDGFPDSHLAVLTNLTPTLFFTNIVKRKTCKSYKFQQTGESLIIQGPVLLFSMIINYVMVFIFLIS